MTLLCSKATIYLTGVMIMTVTDTTTSWSTICTRDTIEPVIFAGLLTWVYARGITVHAQVTSSC